MLGLMQDGRLMISAILRHAAEHHADAEIVSRTEDGGLHRTGYPQVERRARRMASALAGLGVAPGDRVATLAWNGYRHLELYYAISGMQSVCHTINPRLSQDDLAYIVQDAGDVVLFADPGFAALVAALAPRLPSLRAVVMMADRAGMPEVALPPGMALLCYEELLETGDPGFAWPEFDENTAGSLCYTSGTTGRPKGVLYSHRSTLLHALAANAADVLALRAVDRMLPVVPMFHVNAWGIPYIAPMSGTSLIMPGRQLDGASLAQLIEDERVTISAGVPTVWLALLQHLRSTGTRLATLRRLVIGGATCPRVLIDAFAQDYGIRVEHAWGMSEISPIGTYNALKTANAELDGEAALRLTSKQGRALFGVAMRIVDDAGATLPWDGAQSGHLQVRGPWVCSAYFGTQAGSALDAEGWFTTGDVATVDADGYMEITDRSKDVVKSGGEWISSIQLEGIAMSHPDVAEAAIIAARHPKWDERPLLIAVARPGRSIDRAALLAFYDGKVARWCVPDDVLVVDELPHTATGKVHKLSLRARHRDHLVDAMQPADGAGPK